MAGPGGTVFDDVAIDTLLGGGESDWFFAKLGEDKTDDLEAEDLLTAL